MKKFRSQPMYCILVSMLFVVIHIFLIIIVCSFPIKHNQIWIAIIIYSYLTIALLYFFWWLFASLEYVQFTKEGLIIKNIFHTIVIKWNEIQSFKVDYLLTCATSSGMSFKWIEIKTDKTQINKTLISGINHKRCGPWYILARDKIMTEFKKELFIYRRDLMCCLDKK